MGDLQTALDALKATSPEGSNDETPEPTTPPAPEPKEEPQSSGDDQVVRLPNGKEFKVSEIMEWKAGSMKAADYTQKTQRVAETSRQLTEREKALEQREQRIAALEDALREREVGGNPQAQPDFSGLDEMAPGLGKAFQTVFSSNAELKAEIASIRAGQEKAEAEAAQYLQNASADDAMKAALKRFEGDPFANVEDMQAYMEENNLGPEHVDLVYSGLYGFSRGEVKGATAKEQEMIARRANVPPPMGGSQLGIQGGTPQEVVGRQAPKKDLRHTPWQEVRDRAKGDPRVPKVSFD